jgi:hypothetical protein
MNLYANRLGLTAATLLLEGCMGVLTGSGLKEITVPEFGTFRAPGGMDAPRLERDGERMEASMVRGYPWYRFDTIGPNYVTREDVVVVLVNPGLPEARRESLAAGVRYRVGDLDPIGVRMPTWNEEAAGVRRPQVSWRREGNLQWTEGLYVKNSMNDKCWAMVVSDSARGLTVGYRIRQSDASLEKAKRVAQEVAASVKPVAAPAVMFASEKERPARLYKEAMEKLTASLQAKGLRMPQLGETYEQGPYILSFTEDPNGEHRFWMAMEIGRVQAARGWGKEMPATRGFYERLGAFTEAGGEWRYLSEQEVTLPGRMFEAMRRRAPEEGQAVVYAEEGTFFGGDFSGNRTMDGFFQYAAEAKKLLEGGKLAKPWR